MNRLPMPSAMPAELAERNSDRLNDALERDAIEYEAREAANAAILTADYWNERLDGTDAAYSVAQALARVMVNLDAACKGDEISRNAILTALSNLQREARADAYDTEIDRRTA